jgi:hypothetical protein
VRAVSKESFKPLPGFRCRAWFGNADGVKTAGTGLLDQRRLDFGRAG